MKISEKILFKNLAKYHIDKLIICSIEQALYQAIVTIDDEEYLVWADEERCFRTRNLMKMRESFKHLAIAESVLRHESAYDEMIGLEDGETKNRLEVPLGKDPYSIPKWLN